MKLLELRDLRYAPNGDFTDPKVIQTAINLSPTPRGGYKPAYALAASNYATVSNAIGAAVLKRADGTVGLYVGTTTDLKEGDGTSAWTSRGKGGGYTNTATNWQFAVYGNVALATNNVDTPQYSTGAGVAFADLTGAPKAKCVAVLNNVVLWFNYDNGSRVYDGWFGSDAGDYTNYTATASNAVANGRLTDTPGPINAAATINGTAVVWKSRGMYLGRFTGSDQEWTWQLLNADVGCVGPDAWVHTDAGIVFVSERDVFLYDGASLRIVGGNDVRQDIFASPYRQNTLSQIKLTYEPIEGLVYIFTNRSASASGCDYAHLWNHLTRKWGTAGVGGTFGNDTYTYIRAVFRNPNATDAQTRNFTSSSSIGAAAVIESGGKPVVFSGAVGTYSFDQESSLTTATIGSSSRRTTVTRVIPQYLSTPGTETLVVNTGIVVPTASSGVTATWDSTNQRFDVMADTRYASIGHTTLTAEIAGYDVLYEESGLE